VSLIFEKLSADFGCSNIIEKEWCIWRWNW